MKSRVQGERRVIPAAKAREMVQEVVNQRAKCQRMRADLRACEAATEKLEEAIHASGYWHLVIAAERNQICHACFRPMRDLGRIWACMNCGARAPKELPVPKKQRGDHDDP